MSESLDEELLPGRHPRRRWWAWSGYAVVATAVATLIALRVAGSPDATHPRDVPEQTVQSLVPEPVADPFCSTVSPCTVQHTVSAQVAAALSDDAGAALTSAQTYLTSGIELTADSLQWRRLEARAGAVAFVVTIAPQAYAQPLPATGRHGAVQVAAARAPVGRWVIEAVAVGANLPSAQVLARLATDRRLLALG